MLHKRYNDEFLEALQLASKDKKVLADFLQALLTPAEMEELPKRLQIIKLLNAGYTQRQVASELEVAVATISRGARELQNPNSGFHRIISKLK